MLAGTAGAVAAVVTLIERIDAEVLAAAGPHLRIVANVAVGYDNIVIPAAEAAGVTVTNAPGVLDQASADHTFALILAVCRRVTEGDRLVRSGQPWVWGPRMLVGRDAGHHRLRPDRSCCCPPGRGPSTCGLLRPRGSRTAGSADEGTEFVFLTDSLACSDVVSVHTR